jgi:hypothetical protein
MPRYRIVSTSHKVFGASFGEVIEKDLPEAQERRLVAAGHITPVPTTKRPRKAVVLVKEMDNAHQAGSPELLH